MLKKYSLSCVLCCLLLIACSPEQSPLENTFKEHYLAAHKAHDIQALMALFDWTDVSPHIQTATRRALNWESQYPIRSIEVEKTNKGYDATITYDTPERLTTKYLLKEEAGELRIMLAKTPIKHPTAH